ncbi:MAG: hypothetical protein H6721_01045 [Sandaracinus sp.]|nr:hypothetical protein [Sandaracinus sp.]MCB9630730.1 hypothetical protein [Sandaracinus sp.]
MRSFAVSFLLLAACSQSFTSESDASVATPDGSSTIADDAGLDAGRSTPRSACSLESGASFVEGCFCRSPLVARGDYLYVQSQALHVLSREDLREVNRVDERPSAQGGLVHVGGNHLVSAVDFEEPPLRVYALDDPAEPRFVGGFGSDTHGAITAFGDDVLVTRLQGETATLVLYDLSRPSTPRERFAVALEGDPLAIALSEARVFVIEALGSPRERSTLRVLDRDGVERGRLELESAPFQAAALWHAPDLYLAGFGAVVTRVGFEGDDPFVAATTGTSEGLGGALAFVGDLLVGGHPLGVFEGPSLRPLEVAFERGSAQNLVVSGGTLFASSGGSVTELRLACE